MFWKIGFFVLLALLVVSGWLFMKTNPMKVQGSASWVDMYSAAPDETIKFLNDSFGIKHVKSDKDSPDEMDYKIIKAEGQLWPFAGIMSLPTNDYGVTAPPSTMIYLTVKDYESSAAVMIQNGAKLIFGPKIAGGMEFGVFGIPGGLTIGIAQYENVKK